MAEGIILTTVILVSALFLKWKRPFLIGKSGEKFVSRKLHNLDPEQYKVIDDLMLPAQWGRRWTTRVFCSRKAMTRTTVPRGTTTAAVMSLSVSLWPGTPLHPFCNLLNYHEYCGERNPGCPS